MNKLRIVKKIIINYLQKSRTIRAVVFSMRFRANCVHQKSDELLSHCCYVSNKNIYNLYKIITNKNQRNTTVLPEND